MAQQQTGVPSKSTGQQLLASEFNSVNDTINANATDAESRFKTSSGWGNYQDTQYTEVSPLTLVANTDTLLPNNKGSVIESQLPTDITTFYNGTSINGKNGDSLVILIEFKAKPTSVAATNVEAWFDIGGGTPPLFERLNTFPKGSGVERPISYTTLAFNGSTWEANGATVHVRANGPVEIYDIRYLISRQHKAI